MFRFIDIYQNQKVFFEEQIGTKKYWVFEGLGKYPYVTLISTKVGNKAGGNYGWKTLDDALNYIKKKVEEAKTAITSKIERKQNEKLLAVETFNKINIGDIYVTSWGYEAQWYEFYKVVDKKNGFVYLQKLGKNTNYDNNKYGFCSEGCVTPNENVLDGEVFKKKVNAYGFNGKESYEYGASLYNPEKQYEEANWH